MTTADWALGISLFGLAWNVWSKFIFPKPRLQVKISSVMIVSLDDDGPMPRFIRLSVVNHGPIPARIAGVTVVMRRSIFSRQVHGQVQTLTNYLYSDETNLEPTREIAVGHDAASYLPFDAVSVLRRDVAKIGYSDAFGRKHFAPARQVRAVKDELAAAFPDAWTREALKALNAPYWAKAAS
jgi:hypothetical protein